jgi:uncharacterized repeat protein (TIGR01451 family)
MRGVATRVLVLIVAVVAGIAFAPHRQNASAAPAKPTIVMTKTVDRGIALHADELRYTIVVKNVSDQRISVYGVDDPLPERFSYRQGSTDGAREPRVEYEYGPTPPLHCPPGSPICPFVVNIVRETLHWEAVPLDPGDSMTIAFSALASGYDIDASGPYLLSIPAPGLRHNDASASFPGGVASTGEAAPVYV